MPSPLLVPLTLAACLPLSRDGADHASAARPTPPAASSGDLRERKLVASDPATDAELGYAVAGGGDLDGDGYDDVVAGAHQDPALGTAAGAVYVYAGGPTGPGDPLKLQAGDGAAEDRYGAAVALVGDVDGDGYAELAVGAWGQDEAAAGAGAVYLYAGGAAGPDPRSERKLLASDAAADAWFGTALAAGGDLDGDGLEDLAVGAPGDGGRGSVYVYLGAEPSAEVKLQPAELAAGDSYGAALALAGDLDGDGYDDLVVGAPTHDPGVANAGAAWVHPGASAGLAEGARVTARNPQSNDNFGKAVAIAGDLDGDGADDLAVGAHQDDDVSANGGTVHMFWGGGGLPAVSDTVYTAPDGPENGFFGAALAAPGDVDGDGYDDLLVGASGATVDGVAGGAAYLLYGDEGGVDRSRTRALVGADTDGADRYGRAVAAAGDTDGDGAPDLLVGAYAHGDSPLEAGAAYVYLAPCTDGDGDGWCAGEDCDDADPLTFPGAATREDPAACTTDADQDGWGDAEPASGVTAGQDCDDDSALTAPGAAALDSEAACMQDADGDGWGDADPPAGVDAGSDCDDALATVYPGAAPADSPTACMVDHDGDGWGDADPPAGVEAGRDCDDGDSAVYPGAAAAEGDACMEDHDRDGYGDASPAEGVTPGADCDDADPSRSPAAVEVCNGVDDDCEGTADGADAVDGVEFAADADGDGWTDPDATQRGCEAPAGYAVASYLPDCDDADPARSPGAAEVADDGIDQDCDGADLQRGAGCTAAPAAPGLALALAALLAVARRRRGTHR